MIFNLEFKNEGLKKASEEEATKLERAVRLENERNEVRSTIKSFKEKLAALTFEQNALMKTNSSLKKG